MALTFYAFHIMVLAGGYLLLLYVAVLLFAYRLPGMLMKRWMRWVCMLSIPVVWVCSQAAGCVPKSDVSPGSYRIRVPTRAAISALSASRRAADVLDVCSGVYGASGGGNVDHGAPDCP